MSFAFVGRIDSAESCSSYTETEVMTNSERANKKIIF